jgi:hypothetical protein
MYTTARHRDALGFYFGSQSDANSRSLWVRIRAMRFPQTSLALENRVRRRVISADCPPSLTP